MTNKKLIVGTTNDAKVNQLKAALATLPIEIEGIPSDANLAAVVETGNTAEENAIIKATAYAKALQEPVIGMDYALFLNGLADDKQPGLNVRRFAGEDNEPTDEEVIEYYSLLIASVSSQINGHWMAGICLALPNGSKTSATIDIPRIYTSKASETRIAGFPLASLQIHPETGEYISDMVDRFGDKYWQQSVGQKIKAFVKRALQELPL